MSVLFLTALFAIISPEARALAPTIALSGAGDGDSIKIEVTGDASKGVLLYYQKENSDPQLSYIGSTNVSGKLETTLSTANYGIIANSPVHIIINGQRSADVEWPYIAAEAMLALDKTSIVLPIGETKEITAYNIPALIFFTYPTIQILRSRMSA